MISFQIARDSHRNHERTKLLFIRSDSRSDSARISHLHVSDLPSLVGPGDILVVNNSATLPASFTGRHMRTDHPIELRLAQALNEDPTDLRRWKAILLGAGSWKMPTEERGSIPLLRVGDLLEFQSGLLAKITATSNEFNRLVEIEFEGEQFGVFRKIYRAGKPIQYSYLRQDLEIWDQQTLFSGPAVSVEPPSASFPLNWELFLKLSHLGVRFLTVTHSAGLSSTGDKDLDKMLPLPERYWIPEATAHEINQTLERGDNCKRRIIAFGSSVTRALEAAAVQGGGCIQAGPGVAQLRLDGAYKRMVVSGILTGMHEPHTSHVQMLSSFVSPTLLHQAYGQALHQDYLWHEYGDVCLILD